MIPPALSRFWRPRFWPLWLGLALLRLLSLMPLRIQHLAGSMLGRSGFLLAGERRRIAATNLRLCFPELGEDEQQLLLRRHFSSLGQQLIEFGMAFWASDARVRRLWHISGLEHMQAALSRGRGVIVVSGHFAAVEFSGRRLCMDVPATSAIYRPNRNPLMDAVLMRMRSRSIRRLVSKDSIRKLVRCLREGDAVWYAPDQSFRRKGSMLVPFFGVPAMTSGALTALARVSGAAVVPYFAVRRADGRGYDIRIEPALEDFPGESPEADALRINTILERHIREAPEQYYWVHRRFKGRPEPFPDPYADQSADAPDSPSA